MKIFVLFAFLLSFCCLVCLIAVKFSWNDVKYLLNDGGVYIFDKKISNYISYEKD